MVEASNIFRAYDIRGIYGKELNEEIAEKIGKAFGTFIGEGKTLVVARDARVHSESLRNAFVSGLLSVGCNVVDIGLLPTPTFYFTIAHWKYDGGVMITASHLTPEYNGFKLCKERGLLCSEGMGLEKIKSIFETGSFTGPKTQGKISSRNVLEDYEKFILEKVNNKKKFKVVVDVGNGVCSVITPKLLEKIGCEVITLHEELDGTFPNRPSDPTPQTLTKLMEEVKIQNADFGVGLDGDGDRIIFVDERGRCMPGYYSLMLFSKLAFERVQNPKIIFDVCCSSAVEDFIKQNGGVPLVNRVGHSFVMNRMILENAAMAGEYGGKVFFPEVYGFDDATYAALKLTEILLKENKKLSEIVDSLPKYFSTPVEEINCNDDIKFQVMNKIVNRLKNSDYKILDIDGIKVFDGDSWVLIRPSNTAPVIKINAESKTNGKENELLKFGKNIVTEEIENYAK